MRDAEDFYNGGIHTILLSKSTTRVILLLFLVQSALGQRGLSSPAISTIFYLNNSAVLLPGCSSN